MNNAFLEAIVNRRTFYNITSASTIPDERIKEMISAAVKHCPSPFNSQTGRVLLLLNDSHTYFWDVVLKTLKELVPPENFAPTESKIAGFAAGHGTVLFFEAQDAIEALQEKFPNYADNFPVWSEQAAGMLQLTVWTALESEGLGCSLQHYNPLIDFDIKKKWCLPDSWLLRAQMPFGKPSARPDVKSFLPIEERFMVFE